MKCFFAYFAPLIVYLKNLLQLSFYDLVAIGSLIVSGSFAVASYFIEVNYFGVSNLMILFVMITIGANTLFGILKSKIKAKAALLEAQKFKTGPEYQMNMKLYKSFSFDWGKLQFVLFKALTFLSYLKIAQTFLTEGDSFLDWTSAAIIQTPIAIFWYKEWKSFGDNSAYYYGRKASIFEVTEWIFELKLFSQYFQKDKPPKTPEV